MGGNWTPWVLDVLAQSENDVAALSNTYKVSPHESATLVDIPESGDARL